MAQRKLHPLERRSEEASTGAEQSYRVYRSLNSVAGILDILTVFGVLALLFGVGLGMMGNWLVGAPLIVGAMVPIAMFYAGAALVRGLADLVRSNREIADLLGAAAARRREKGQPTD